MDIVKKNILSILCGVVALVGVIAWFFPIGGMYDNLEKKVEESASKYDQLEGLRKASRVKPTLVLDSDTGPEPLGRFPNEKTIEAGRKATEALAEQSSKMLGTVTELNIHVPLTPGSLPRPQAQARLDFTYQYRDVLGLGEEGWGFGIPAELNATTPPSEEQIEAKAEQLWATKYAVQVVEIGGQNNLSQIEDQFLAEVKGLPDQEREQAALKHKVYLNENALPVSPDIVAGQNPTAEEIWFAQTALWITEDVAEAIKSANSKASNITDAPIKHLVAIQVPFGIEQYVMAGGKASGAGNAGAATIAVDDNGAPIVWSASPTGRVCNDLYDVIHFGLVLRVEARKVPQVLAELERNKLITVLQANVIAIDAQAERKQNGYVYGNEAVVEIQLKCEALFLRSWTVDAENERKNALMPDEVQEAIGAKPKAEAGPE